MASYETPPAAVTLDIDDTSMSFTVTGSQRCSTPMEPALGPDPRDERCFLLIHVFDTAVSRPVAVLLCPGKAPSRKEVRGHLRRLVRRISRHWPLIQITIRGDGHYSRPEVMAWCEENGIGFIFGLPGNTPSIAWAMKPPMTSEHAARSNTNLPWGASRRPVTKPSPGTRTAVSVPASSPPQRGSISASSSPASTPVRPSMSMRPSTGPAARPRT
jgi:hypothetical protein